MVKRQASVGRMICAVRRALKEGGGNGTRGGGRGPVVDDVPYPTIFVLEATRRGHYDGEDDGRRKLHRRIRNVSLTRVDAALSLQASEFRGVVQ